ncbi:MAG: hypothetical protein EA352_09630 [Gemmatimonadales bacterium]|nr:MAG: hypothetical protein EA352_09630 [Gemmatimonadales bacterium]
MRRFTDARGQAWDVTPGRASWGALFGLFVPVSSGPEDTREVLQAPVAADTMEELALRLDQMPEDELRALLEKAGPALS